MDRVHVVPERGGVANAANQPALPVAAANPSLPGSHHTRDSDASTEASRPVGQFILLSSYALIALA